MFLSARCIAARRLAFSLANDSAQALKMEINRCSLINDLKAEEVGPMTSGRFFDGQEVWII